VFVAGRVPSLVLLKPARLVPTSARWHIVRPRRLAEMQAKAVFAPRRRQVT
jgi:hypothetical protein